MPREHGPALPALSDDLAPGQVRMSHYGTKYVVVGKTPNAAYWDVRTEHDHELHTTEMLDRWLRTFRIVKEDECP